MSGEDEGAKRSTLNAALGICLIILGPPLVLIAYFLVFSSRSAVPDYGALAVATIVGSFGIGMLPVPIWARILLLTGYLILAIFLAPYLAVGFACAVKGLCL